MHKFEGFLLQETQLGWMVFGSSPAYNAHHSIVANVLLTINFACFGSKKNCLKRSSTLMKRNYVKSYLIQVTREIKVDAIRSTFRLRNLTEQELPSFGQTDYNALKRFKQLESTFKQKPIFAREYNNFMKEYEALNHMVNLGKYPTAIPKNAYFLPHHGVLREDSTTTKLRVVFDGGNRKPPYPSLNDEICAGPALQNDLPTIITRWRRHCVAFSADLEKMFRQINICLPHQPYQCILWRNSLQQLCVYVTYGTTSAPYLAIRVLQQLAKDEEYNFKTASSVLRTDTYVDDVISGTDTPDEAVHLQQELSVFLKSGGFHLRKWNSNSTILMNSICVARS